MRPGVPSSAVGALAPSGTGSGAPHKVRLLDETEAGRLLQAKQREHAEAERRRKEEAERRKQELHQVRVGAMAAPSVLQRVATLRNRY